MAVVTERDVDVLPLRLRQRGLHVSEGAQQDAFAVAVGHGQAAVVSERVAAMIKSRMGGTKQA